jgi:RNA polymerase sigma factor for flagellar operon FliA
MRRARAGLALIERAPRVEAALWRRLRFEADPSCREPLFDRYAPLARAIARHEHRRRPPYGLEAVDFEQLAYGGLLEAIDRFEPLHGAPFEAFARRRIKGAISDGMARSSESAAQFSARRRLEQERTRSLLAGERRGENAIAELADLATALAIGLMAENAKLEGGRADGALGGYESVTWRDMQLKVLEEIDRLPSAERTVMQQHFLNDVPFVQVAAVLGVSKGRVAQLHRAALTRLRGRLQRGDLE